MRTFACIVPLMLVSSLLFAHAEESVSPSRVGREKGILSADEHEGFVLRPSVEQNFAIRKMPLPAGPVWTVPVEALVYSGLETQVLRQRDEHWKSVDVDIVRRSARTVTLRSKDLAAGDQLAIAGAGSLKVMELSVFGPAADHH